MIEALPTAVIQVPSMARWACNGPSASSASLMTRVAEVVADQADHDAVAQSAVEPPTGGAGRLPRGEPHVDDADHRRRHPLQHAEADSPYGQLTPTPAVREGQRRHPDADEENVGERSEPEQPAEGQVRPPRDQDCADRAEAQQLGRRRRWVVEECRTDRVSAVDPHRRDRRTDRHCEQRCRDHDGMTSGEGRHCRLDVPSMPNWRPLDMASRDAGTVPDCS